MIGVSPSFFFSKYSTNFSIDDYIDGLKDLKILGVDCFQGEIYKKENIEEWEEGANKLALSYKKLNLKMSLFVAHFLINYTKDFDSLFNDSCYQEFKRVCSLVKENFKEVNTIVIPIAKYNVKDEKREDYQVVWNQFKNMINKLSLLASEYDFNLALEIIPGSIVGGIDGLLRLIAEIESNNLGYNLDTGHANCSGEVLSLIPSKLKGKIFGTHLKDNFGSENLALPLGKGNIDFKQLNEALAEFNYLGSYDLEINSDCENVMMDYSIGVSYLKKYNIGC